MATAHLIAFALTTFGPGIDPEEMLQYVSWWAYVAVIVGYSALIFRKEFSREGPLLFSGKNDWSASRILSVHASYVVIMVCFIRLAGLAVLYLPKWMTNTFETGRSGSHVPVSFADFCVLTGISLLALSERRRLYGDSDESEVE